MSYRIVQSLTFLVPFWVVALAFYIVDGVDSPGHWVGLATCLLCIVAGAVGVWSIGESRKLVGSISWVHQSEIVEAECIDSSALRWVPAYAIPALSFLIFDGWSTFASLVWASAWLVWVLSVTKTCYQDPMLVFLGWHVYRVSIRMSMSGRELDMMWLSLGPLRTDGTVVLSSWQDGTVRLVRHTVDY